ncbi:M20 family metallo-hydrolase [Cryobacterium psychrophilum]|uniref:Zn-dependent hydrolase n=1 Tax=Cryobacterium psychrophilum TaxID=41988 RepID=A0A4Y8KL31_9MICO|nr:M20 family metallo-hydrolase [Cryobacterium psychrophilum]TDW30064.1 N-carbamoyl-L-amino-acid hydrolase [Cryobacterium psychrophilum]TFD76010.1 Zn-dependent hydrolase [Cryobacterium psychrophilum]
MSTSTEQQQAFLADFRSMSSFGATAGSGVDRQAATAADGQTRNWFRGLVEGHGFEVRYDQVGNQFTLVEFVPGAPYIAIGSHLDSQPLGGRFDGAYGVLAGAHAAMRLREAFALEGGIPLYNIVIINWFNEEGCRFKPSMMGSSVFTGKLPAEQVLATTDSQGVTVLEALESIGTIGNFNLEVAAYLEIHIEQGRSLEDDGLSIGLVESTWGANKYEFVVHGEQAHTGATEIADRSDALLGASALVVAAREIANQFTTDEHMVITSCGEFTVFPNSPVVVASRVNLLVDVRSTDPTVLAAADAELHRRVTDIEQWATVRFERGAEHIWAAKEYDAAGLLLAAASAEKLGLPYGTVRTRAGHDSTNMKDIVPTIMLFVPSADGISHNEREFTSDADMLAGVDLLTDLARRLVMGELVHP